MFLKTSSIILASILAVSALAGTAKVVQTPEAKVELSKEQEKKQEKLQKRLEEKFQQQLKKQSIEVVWDAESEAEKYTLYYGFAPRSYGFKVELDSSENSIRLDGLSTGRIFYFSLTSTTDGIESDFSEEISFTGGTITDIVVGNKKTKITINGEPKWKSNLGYLNKKGSLKFLKTIENESEKFELTVPTTEGRKYLLIPQE